MKSLMNRRALLIGINDYQKYHQLVGCVADAKELCKLIAENEDGSPNYSCRLLTSEDPVPVTRASLRTACRNLFRDFSGEVLFYFSGHGSSCDTGDYLVTQDGTKDEPGLRMNELLDMATLSHVSEGLIILDCCYAGSIGNQLGPFFPGALVQTQLREGITILAASRPKQTAKEFNGHGLFTSLVIGALSGGSADVRGRVSAASIYGYVEQALGPWDQRPLYKSYATALSPIRYCNPIVPDELLRKLPQFFKSPNKHYRLNPRYEVTHPRADESKVAIFNIFKLYRNAGLLRTVEGDDLFNTAMNSNFVELTPLGQFYRLLVLKQVI